MTTEKFNEYFNEYKNLFLIIYPNIYNEIDDIIEIIEKGKNQSFLEGTLEKIDRNKSIDLVKEFLDKIDLTYSKKFSKDLKENKINLFTKEEAQKKIDEEKKKETPNEQLIERLEFLIENGSNSIWKYDFNFVFDPFVNNESQFFIDILLEENLSDTISIIHEFTHGICDYFSENHDTEEIQPILSEYIFVDFLREKGYKEEMLTILKQERGFKGQKLIEEELPILKMLSLSKKNQKITKEKLNLDEEKFNDICNSFISNLVETEEFPKSYIRHFYATIYAKKIYEKTKDERIETWLNLNFSKSMNDTSTYLEEVKNIIKEKPRVKVITPNPSKID